MAKLLWVVALLVSIPAASAVSIPASDAIDAAFQHKESEVVAYTKAGFSEGALTPAVLLDPFVEASREQTRFKTPYVKVSGREGLQGLLLRRLGRIRSDLQADRRAAADVQTDDPEKIEKRSIPSPESLPKVN